MNYASAYLESLPSIMEEYNPNGDKSSQLMKLLTEILLAIGCFIESRRPVCQLSLDKYLKKVDRAPSKSARQSPAQSFENHH
jgi:hypothetical protein